MIKMILFRSGRIKSLKSLKSLELYSGIELRVVSSNKKLQEMMPRASFPL